MGSYGSINDELAAKALHKEVVIVIEPLSRSKSYLEYSKSSKTPDTNVANNGIIHRTPISPISRFSFFKQRDLSTLPKHPEEKLSSIDLSSPLGLRIYRERCVKDPFRGVQAYEKFCSTNARAIANDRQGSCEEFPCVYKAPRHHTPRDGSVPRGRAVRGRLSKRSRRLQKLMKRCSVSISKLDMLLAEKHRAKTAAQIQKSCEVQNSIKPSLADVHLRLLRDSVYKRKQGRCNQALFVSSTSSTDYHLDTSGVDTELLAMQDTLWKALYNEAVYCKDQVNMVRSNSAHGSCQPSVGVSKPSLGTTNEMADLGQTGTDSHQLNVGHLYKLGGSASDNNVQTNSALTWKRNSTTNMCALHTSPRSVKVTLMDAYNNNSVRLVSPVAMALPFNLTDSITQRKSVFTTREQGVQPVPTGCTRTVDNVCVDHFVPTTAPSLLVDTEEVTGNAQTLNIVSGNGVTKCIRVSPRRTNKRYLQLSTFACCDDITRSPASVKDKTNLACHSCVLPNADHG